MTLKIMTMFLLALAVCPGCKKETKLSTEQLLTKAVWKMTARTIQDGSNPPVDQFSSLPECSRDDIYSINDDQTYIITNGATACAGEPAILQTATWQLSHDKKVFYYELGSTSYYYDIEELTENSLTLKVQENNHRIINKFS